MKKYNVVIKNATGAKIYNELVEAENENKALIKVLQEEIIYKGDTITIEE